MKKDRATEIEEIFDNLDRRHMKYDRQHYTKVISEYYQSKIKLDEMRHQKNLVTRKDGDYDQARLAKQLIQQQEEVHEKAKRDYQALPMPNILSKAVPYGASENENVILHQEGEIKFSKHHYDMPIFMDTSKIAGSRFVVLKPEIAKLQRAIAQFALHYLEDKGFEEYDLPYLMNIAAAKYTKHDGDLDDMFTTTDGKFLIPTGENPLLCLAYKKRFTKLPWKICTITDCFRKEAGAAGRDTKGLIRLHQFKKVEMVVFTEPEKSDAMLQELVDNTVGIVRAFGLPYQIMQLCSGDTGHRSAQTIDINIPIGGRFRECASDSNCKDYQARSLLATFHRDHKHQHVHILNATCVALSRMVASILEHYYDPARNVVHIPRALHPYVRNTEIDLTKMADVE